MLLPAFPCPQVTKAQRDHAKQLTYGLLYGMGPAKLADELGCSVGEAKDAQVGGWRGQVGGRLESACLCQQFRMHRAAATLAPPSLLPVAPVAFCLSARRTNSGAGCRALRPGRHAWWPTAGAWATLR